MAHEIHVSVVSHGHAEHIERLLSDLALLPDLASLQLTLTLNVPETLDFPLETLPFPYKLRQNTRVFSFSKNHNLAFHDAPKPENARYFLVLNPDTRLQGAVLTTLTTALNKLKSENVGVVGPLVKDEHGQRQQNGRVFPSAGYLLLKLLGREPENPVHEQQGYARVEWLAGMCMLLQKDVYQQLGGFDENYRLYYEDVDLCLRLKQAELDTALILDAEIVHIGQWKSRRNITHLIWHCSSALRFLVKLFGYKFRASRKL